jgi:hypothetical protein
VSRTVSGDKPQWRPPNRTPSCALEAGTNMDPVYTVVKARSTTYCALF